MLLSNRRCFRAAPLPGALALRLFLTLVRFLVHTEQRLLLESAPQSRQGFFMEFPQIVKDQVEGVAGALVGELLKGYNINVDFISVDGQRTDVRDIRRARFEQQTLDAVLAENEQPNTPT